MRSPVRLVPAPSRLDSIHAGLAIAALAVAGLLVHAGCASGEESTCNEVLKPGTLDPGVGFGGLEIGMSKDEVRGFVGSPERTMGEAWEYMSCGFALLFAGEDPPKVSALVAGDMNGGDLTERFTAETLEGLGMGSSREDITAALGPPSDVLEKGPGVDTLVYVDRGVSWTLRDGHVVHLTVRRPR